MKSLAVRITIAILLACVVARARDSRFFPNDQQIPLPDCLSAAKDQWLDGSKVCSEAEHASWLADIRHWRDERRNRIGYDGSRL